MSATFRTELSGGEFEGRTLFDNLNLRNPNATAVEIAQRTLSQICHATGVLQLSDSEQLHFKPMIAVVGIRPARTDPNTGTSYSESNQIKEYKPTSGEAFTAPAKAAPKPVAPPPAREQRAANTPPWKK